MTVPRWTINETGGKGEGLNFWKNDAAWEHNINQLKLNDAEAEAPILWPPDANNWLIGKDPSAGKDWRQEEKGMTKDEMVGWYHQLDGQEFEQALGVGDG